MACRNCVDICNCAFQSADSRAAVSGSGTATDPYIITVAPVTQSDTYTYPGTLVAGAGTIPRYFSHNATITNVSAGVGTAPTGAAIRVDVNKNGTTIFTTAGNRPNIAVSTNSDTASTPDVTAITAGDYITIDLDTVGSGVAGADLTVTIEYYR